MTRQEREAAAIAETNRQYRAMQLDALLTQMRLVQDVVFAATNFIDSHPKTDADVDILYNDLAGAVANLNYKKGGQTRAH